MGIERDDGDERQERVERIMTEFREAEQRRLLKRGIQVWSRIEKAQQDSRPLRRSPLVGVFD